MHYRLFGFGNFDENNFELFTKHGLGKVRSKSFENFTKHSSGKVEKVQEKSQSQKRTSMNRMLDLYAMN